MASPNPNSSFEIGPPKDYLGGHIAIGMVTLIEAALPAILWFAWQRGEINNNQLNVWYKYSWKSMSYGGLIAFFIPFLFWCMSFSDNNTLSYLYVAMLVLFAGLYGSYVTASTIIFQFQGIRNYNSMDSKVAKDDIWAFFGVYTGVQLLAAFIGQHYLFDSVMYLLAANI